MYFAFDPLIANLILWFSLIPHLGKPKIGESPSANLEAPPFVSVIVTFYREKPADIDMTVASLISQTYPKDKYEVLIVTEPDDIAARQHVENSIERLRLAGISGRSIISDGKLKIKPHALNAGIEQARGEVCAFYDASDDIESGQLEKATSLMIERDYDVVQATVLRKGTSLLSHFLLFDSIFWFRKYLPLILRNARGMPLSGEGLFIRRSVLEQVGYFPEVLTEDAYLGLLLTENSRRFALVDSVVVEKAPKNTKSHFRQKLRWFRGYLSCLRKVPCSRLSFRQKLFFLLPYTTPITSALSFLGWLFFIGSWICWFILWALGTSGPLMQHNVYGNSIVSWSMLLACIGIPLSILSYAHTLFSAQMGRRIPLLALAPYYWIFVGFCAFCALFRNNRDWVRTER